MGSLDGWMRKDNEQHKKAAGSAEKMMMLQEPHLAAGKIREREKEAML